MAYELYQDIKIADFRFSRSNSVEVRKSTSTIGATAIIKVPISAVIENKGERGGVVEVAKAIKVGDRVEILLGYHTRARDYENVEFTGFVKRINYKIPLEIECEDNNYILRKKKINKSWKSTTLEEVLHEIVKNTGIIIQENIPDIILQENIPDIILQENIPDITLAPFYLKNVDGAFALQKLADEYGLTVYFKRDGSLYVGLAYTEETGTTTLVLNGDDQNVIDADDLKYRNADDVKLKVKAIAIQGDNTRIETEIGDEDGAQRTLNFYNIKTLAELVKLAKQEIKKYKYDGYEGKLKCFLIPFVDPAFKVTVLDPIFPDREGEYFVESTIVTYGTGGIRREIEIGIKL